MHRTSRNSMSIVVSVQLYPLDSIFCRTCPRPPWSTPESVNVLITVIWCAFSVYSTRSDNRFCLILIPGDIVVNSGSLVNNAHPIYECWGEKCLGNTPVAPAVPTHGHPRALEYDLYTFTNCLLVFCLKDNSKHCRRILTTFFGGEECLIGNSWLDFGADPVHDPDPDFF